MEKGRIKDVMGFKILNKYYYGYEKKTVAIW